MRALGPAVSALLAPVLLAACEPDGESEAGPGAPAGAREAAPGTVLLVGEVPVSLAEVERFAAPIAEAFPGYVPRHLLRLALTRIVLPRAALAARWPGERRTAREACQRAREDIADPKAAPEGVPGAEELAGTFRTLNLDLWCVARSLPLGLWSEPTELIGRFVLLRLEAIELGRTPLEDRLVLARLEFPYVDPADPQAAIDAALDEIPLRILDEEWQAIVPESWKYRMRPDPR